MAMVGWNLFKHPEEAKGEVFLGNTSKHEWYSHKYAGLTTIRVGEKAFDIDGNLMDPSEGHLPLFIAEREQPLYELMMTRRPK